MLHPENPSSRSRESLYLVAIHQILQTIDANLPLSQVLETLINATIVIFDANTTWLILEEEGKLRVKVARGDYASQLEGQTLSRTGSLIAEAWNRGGMVTLKPEDIPPQEPLLGTLKTTNQLIFLIPFQRDSQPVGMIGCLAPHEPAEALQIVLPLFAEMAAIAVRNAALNIEKAQAQAELVQAKNRLEAVLNSVTEGILVCDSAGQIIFANPQVHRFFGFPEGSLLNGSLEDFINQIRILHPHPEKETLLLHLLQVEPGRIHRDEVVTSSPEQRWLERTVSPVYDAERRLTGHVFVFHDVTSLRTIQRHLEQAIQVERETAEEALLLYESARSLVEALSLQDHLNRFMENLRRLTTASRCLVWLVEDQTLVPTAEIGLTPNLEDLFYWEQIPLDSCNCPVHQALHRQQPLLLSPQDAQKVCISFSRWSPPHSLILPLVFEEQTIGLAIAPDAQALLLHRSGLRLPETLAHLASIAIHNAQKYEHERRIAETLQKSFLSPPPKHPYFDIYAYYMAVMEEAYIGGDFYDFITLPDQRLGVVIGDISGKGLQAAVFTAMYKNMLKALIFEHERPSIVLSRFCQTVLQEHPPDMFITLLYLLLDPLQKTLTYANAGHPPGFLIPFGDDTLPPQSLPAVGPPLGILAEIEYPEVQKAFRPGDLLLLYTDGLIEARGQEIFFGVERLENLIRSGRKRGPREWIDYLVNEVKAFAQNQLQDDLALVTIQFRGGRERE